MRSLRGRLVEISLECAKVLESLGRFAWKENMFWRIVQKFGRYVGGREVLQEQEQAKEEKKWCLGWRKVAWFWRRVVKS